MLILIIFVFSILLSLIFSLLPSVLGQKDSAHTSMVDSFECGFERFSTSRLPFSLKFFLVVMVFLVFDIEIVILLPYCLMLTHLNSINVLLGLGISLFILLFGLLLEWYQGSFEWAS
jgi:NADH-ubiquinone oxidoreductase chain 3